MKLILLTAVVALIAQIGPANAYCDDYYNCSKVKSLQYQHSNPNNCLKLSSRKQREACQAKYNIDMMLNSSCPCADTELKGGHYGTTTIIPCGQAVKQMEICKQHGWSGGDAGASDGQGGDGGPSLPF
jgi:hypothetical protein